MTVSFPGSAKFLLENPSLPRLRSAVRQCRGCDLYLRATQAVLGEIDGERPATHTAIMMIGERPGDNGSGGKIRKILSGKSVSPADRSN